MKMFACYILHVSIWVHTRTKYMLPVRIATGNIYQAIEYICAVRALITVVVRVTLQDKSIIVLQVFPTSTVQPHPPLQCGAVSQ